jgi:hypothetical protein
MVRDAKHFRLFRQSLFFAGTAGNNSGLCSGLGPFAYSRYQLSLCNNT